MLKVLTEPKRLSIVTCNMLSLPFISIVSARQRRNNVTETAVARNVEIKAFARDLDELVKKAQQLSSQPSETIAQTDVFFRVAVGRLKLRILSPAHGELIFYDRTDQAGPKTSTYTVSTTNQPFSLRAVLSAAYGEDVIIRKIRKRYLIGRTRVHVDAVENLGDFIELEVVLSEGENPEDGVVEARNLMAELGIKQDDLIENAYADLLKAQKVSA